MHRSFYGGSKEVGSLGKFAPLRGEIGEEKDVPALAHLISVAATASLYLSSCCVAMFTLRSLIFKSLIFKLEGGGPDCFVSNFSSFVRRLKGSSF